MSDHLASILEAVTRRLQDRRSRTPLAELRARGRDQPPPLDLASALRRPSDGTASGLRVMGELKRRSPSAGPIHPGMDAPAMARELASAGCRAISVLTEPDFFGGSLEALASVRSAVSVPLLRKDFVVDPYQVVEARAYGADAVLLLAAVLDDDALRRCQSAAEDLGLQVLAEAHGPDELERLLAAGMPVIGVNARNLGTFEVDLKQALSWIAQIPAGPVVVAESGIRTREDALAAAHSRADAVLVGEGLMRGGRPGFRFVELFGKDG